ncbi:MAG: hypothetical protein H6978_06390 [Gammaproteobacteria bacterium]|nr:hypothetical protein [Gammaproteobacteria bacterium]
MRNLSLAVAALAAIVLCNIAAAQPAGITMEMINTTLPLEGAPLAVVGPYAVIKETAVGAPRYVTYRPADLSAFPARDRLPVLVWGNGGCAIDGGRYAEFLGTIASHGFLVMTTTALEGEGRMQQTPPMLVAAVDWAQAENQRAGSPLEGKIDMSHVAVMGQSCGGMLSVGLGTDPRVGTIGVFNSGVSAPNPEGQDPNRPTTADLARVHGPVLFINGHERDFMLQASRANFDLVNNVPTFYGARHGAGHTATVFHPGGGEYANVAANWLRYQFKGDSKAGEMFVGSSCSLCTDANWDTAAKGLR